MLYLDALDDFVLQRSLFSNQQLATKCLCV